MLLTSSPADLVPAPSGARARRHQGPPCEELMSTGGPKACSFGSLSPNVACSGAGEVQNQGCWPPLASRCSEARAARAVRTTSDRGLTHRPITEGLTLSGSKQNTKPRRGEETEKSWSGVEGRADIPDGDLCVGDRCRGMLEVRTAPAQADLVEFSVRALPGHYFWLTIPEDIR